MQLILLIFAILALLTLKTASAYEEVRCKTSAENFQIAHKIISRKLKPEIILETLCKKSKDGCSDFTGAIRAMKSIAAQRVFCDVTDPENLERKYARLLPGARNSTSLTVGGYYDDDDDNADASDDDGDDASGDDDAADDDDSFDDDSFDDDGSCSDYSCESRCTDEVIYGCINDCSDSVSDCSDVEDIVSIPACIESASSCMKAIGGACCTCPCKYQIYCCTDC